MPRANRHYIPGYVWHITHRCHKKEFLLKFARDRRRWIEWLFAAKKRHVKTTGSALESGQNWELRRSAFFKSSIPKVRYGKVGNSQYAQCVQYLSSRNMKTKNVSRDTIQKIRVDQISPNPNQARIDFDKAGLMELAESIKATGLLQPIIVKPVGNRFQIIAGERRWRAHQLSGLSEIDAIIRNSDNSVVESLIENIQREDLSAFEEAAAFKRLLDTGITQKELSRQIGKSRTYIAQKVRLLELGTDVRTAMESKAAGEPLYEGAARQLLRLKPIDDTATTSIENLPWSHFFTHLIIWRPNYFRTVADVQFGVDEYLAFLYRCSIHNEEELERKADILLKKSEQGEELSTFRWGAPLMWSLIRPDFGKLTRKQVSKLRDALIRYNKEYLKRYPSRVDM